MNRIYIRGKKYSSPMASSICVISFGLISSRVHLSNVTLFWLKDGWLKFVLKSSSGEYKLSRKLISDCVSLLLVPSLNNFSCRCKIAGAVSMVTDMQHDLCKKSDDDCLVSNTVYNKMTSSNGNIFRVTGHFCGEFTGHRWIPCTKASDAEL